MSTAPPLLSLVCAVHDQGEHLPAFFETVEHQQLPLSEVEVVVVDCGSRDDSVEQVRGWAARTRATVHVLSAPGASVGAARNTGLAAATGTWVSFPRVVDGFEADYLSRVAAFTQEHPASVLLSANRLISDAGNTNVGNNHPLRMFHRGDRTLDLEQAPEVVVGDPSSTFFRRDLVEEHQVRFHDLWSGAPDAFDFAWRLLLRSPSRMVALMRSAKYHQRRNVLVSGRLPTMLPPTDGDDPTVEMLRTSYLGTLHEAASQAGGVPTWLEHQLVFGLSHFFHTNDSRPPVGVPIDAEERADFHAVVGEILGRIDVDDVVPYGMGRVPRATRYVLQHGYREESWQEPFVLMSDLDDDQHLVKFSYFYTGEDPVEEFRSNGVRTEPVHAKTRHLYYTGRLLLKQRIAWVPFRGMMEARLDGREMDLALEQPPFPRRRVTQGVAGWFLRPDSTRITGPADKVQPRPAQTREGRKAQRIAARERARRKYAGAWVLMDRLHDAGDNAEAMFRHLRRHEPEINAWFVLEEGSPHWDKLVREGYKDRMVAHGSVEWRVLMSHAAHLLSSHADLAVTAPEAIAEVTPAKWRFTFLQHGVIMFDLSNWLNAKKLDVLVTSTKGEFHSIAGDTSQYNVTTREVALTGMPRWDRLLDLSKTYDATSRNLILVAPTWRKWLLPPIVPGSQKRPLDLSALDTEFFRSWKALLSDERLEKVARDHGLEVGFLPHPNLQPLLGHLDLPAHVQPLTYAEHDVQELISRARLMVTDYSSIAFDAAYTGRPLAYFQFDTEEMLEGSHVGSRGYFDFQLDGFGPVAHTLDDAVRAIQEVVEAGADPMPQYAARIADTFAGRDGGCCARVVEAVRRSVRPADDGPVVPTPSASREWR